MVRIDEVWLDQFAVSKWLGGPLVTRRLIGQDSGMVLQTFADLGDYYRFTWFAVRLMPWAARLSCSTRLAQWALQRFEKTYPDDLRPRQAVEQALLVQREPSIAHMIAASLAVEPARIAAFAAVNDSRWHYALRNSLSAETAAGAAKVASSDDEGQSINATFETFMDAAGAVFSDHRKNQTQIMEYLLPQIL